VNNPPPKPDLRLHPGTHCFVQWLESQTTGDRDSLADLRERLEVLYDCRRGCDCRTLWNELFRSLFDQWVASVHETVSGDDLQPIVEMILGERKGQAPEDRESLARRLGELREKIAQVLGEDEEFEPDLTELDKSLATYQQVLGQFQEDPRLDEVVRRGVEQALAAKERDFAWLEALLERLRAERAAQAAEPEPDTDG